ncbi:MAG: hypothetical protein ACRD3W_06110 [Terriglobales bacterium]
MQLIETTVSLTTVRMQLANYADPEKATEWVEFEMPSEKLMKADGNTPLGDPVSNRLVTVQLSALQYVRDAIDEEIQRLLKLASAAA